MIPGVDGFMYPNEVELQWSVLIVLYPFITGLVAGAFILASLERVFKVEAVRPTYRLALLTALWPSCWWRRCRCNCTWAIPSARFEMYLTPHTLVGHGHVRLRLPVVPDGGAAAGDLAGVPRRYRARWRKPPTGFMRWIYRALTLGSMNVSPRARTIDDKVGYARSP